MPPSSRVISIAGGLVAALGLLLVVGSLSTAAESPQAQQPPPTPGPAAAASPAATPTPLSLETLSQIQPGLSTYMLEAAQRLGVMWFAAKQNNWDLAAFEARETEGVLQHGAVRSNQSRQQGIAAFDTALLEPLIKAAQAGDQFFQTDRVVRAEISILKGTKTKGNSAIAVKNGDHRLAFIQGERCLSEHVRRSDSGWRQNDQHAGAAVHSSFDLSFPALSGADVDFVHPDLRTLRLEVFGEANGKFHVFAAIADEGGGWVDGQRDSPGAGY